MICRFCGQNKEEGQYFSEWVRPTFTDHDKLLPGEIVCKDCAFWFEESSQLLAGITGKDKPQRMRNYSHFIVNDKWYPLSKSDKTKMIELLLGEPFPELAAVAESGQKHIVFRAIRNPQGSRAGWLQFEEQRIWINPLELKSLIDTIENGLSVFSKSELASGNYLPYRIIQFGLSQWQALEAVIKSQRGSLFFQLALFLSQRKETETNDGATGGTTRDGGGPAGNSLAGHRQRLQEPVPANNLGAVRELGEGVGFQEQPGQIRQLGLF